MDNIICMVLPQGAIMPMKIRILLRLFNALVIVGLYKKYGLDWVIVYGLIIVIADLDAIADAINERCRKK